MRRPTFIWTATCCLVIAVAPVAADETPRGPTAEAIERWVVDLDSGSFAVRRSASRHLRQIGGAAVGSLVTAANGDRAEVARRAVDILDELCRTSEGETEAAARAGLRQLAASPYPDAAQPAAAALRWQRIVEQRRAIVAIRRLGGEVTVAAMDDGEFVVGEVALSRAWTGGEAGLQHLVRLVHVQHLLLHGVAFSDESLAKVRELAGLQTIRLYATDVTDEGEEALRKAFPSAKIDRRRGAMLGVSGSTDARGCKVEYVLANGAAQLAGIEAGDVITQIGPKTIRDLPGMIAVIAKYKAGEQVRIEFLRGAERLSREVVFGEMPIDAFR
ncbi:MAG TPA: PDZ domain-containing protein [Pirellulales bacterium]|nr:PDZ domain-containing protein [Pirellulales bacterium]